MSLFRIEMNRKGISLFYRLSRFFGFHRQSVTNIGTRCRSKLHALPGVQLLEIVRGAIKNETSRLCFFFVVLSLGHVAQRQAEIVYFLPLSFFLVS